MISKKVQNDPVRIYGVVRRHSRAYPGGWIVAAAVGAIDCETQDCVIIFLYCRYVERRDPSNQSQCR